MMERLLSPSSFLLSSPRAHKTSDLDRHIISSKIEIKINETGGDRLDKPQRLSHNSTLSSLLLGHFSVSSAEAN